MLLHIGRVKLCVGPGADGFVAAHEQGEGAHLHPAGEELSVPLQFLEGEEAADVAVDHRHAGKAQGECSCTVRKQATENKR